MNSSRSYWNSLMCVLLLFVGCSGARESIDRAEIEKHFSEAFGGELPSEAAELRCRIVTVGDSMNRWFSFRCGDAAFRGVLGNRFTKATRKDLDDPQIPELTNPNAPQWWPKAPRMSIDELYYFNRPYKDGQVPAESSYGYLWRDDATGIVYGNYCSWR